MDDAEFVASLDCLADDLRAVIIEAEKRAIEPILVQDLRDAAAVIFEIGIPLHQSVYGCAGEGATKQ